jgi:hypothetical protein
MSVDLAIRPERIEPGKSGQNGHHKRMHRNIRSLFLQLKNNLKMCHLCE